MSGIDLHVVQELVRSAQTTLPAEEIADRVGSEARRDRLVDVMRSLSGRIDIDDQFSAAEIDLYRSDATLERLAQVGLSFGR